ncbi:helitron helicase-like domain-containing protein [Tanacetum coccineum]
MKMISLSLGHVRKEILSHLGSGTLVSQGLGCPAMSKTRWKWEIRKTTLKLFQSAAKTEGWAMPTWCHMFNSTLTGNARVWFDKLPKESIDSYEDLRTAFRENYLQQTKHIKDLVEIHHIKQRDGESTEDFHGRYKAEVLDVEELGVHENNPRVCARNKSTDTEVSTAGCLLSEIGQCKRQKRKRTCSIAGYQSRRINNNRKRVCRWQKSCTDPIGTQYLGQESMDTTRIQSSRPMPVLLQPSPEYPAIIKELYENTHFMENIRAYNQMFSMTSLGANVDKSINNGKGPYVFRISGQIYHWIGSMCPEEGQPPRFLQLYIYDTTNEVKNRMAHFHNQDELQLKEEIVEGLIEFLDKHNLLPNSLMPNSF